MFHQKKEGAMLQNKSLILTCFVLFLLILKSTSASAQIRTNPDSWWLKQYRIESTTGNPNGFYSDIKMTPDNGHILVGKTSRTPLIRDAVVTKIDSLGNVVSSKKYSGQDSTFLSHVDLASNDQYVASGLNCVPGTPIPDCKPWIVRFKENGDLLWSKVFQERTRNKSIHSQIRNQRGNYLVAGGANTSTNHFGWVAEFNPSGNIVWEKFYNVRGSIILELKEKNDGSGYIAFARLFSGAGNSFQLVEINNIGNVTQSKEYKLQNNGNFFASNFNLLSDNSMIVTGSLFENPLSKGLALKISENTEIKWAKVFSGFEGTSGRSTPLAIAAENKNQILISSPVSTSTGQETWIGNLSKNSGQIIQQTSIDQPQAFDKPVEIHISGRNNDRINILGTASDSIVRTDSAYIYSTKALWYDRCFPTNVRVTTRNIDMLRNNINVTTFNDNFPTIGNLNSIQEEKVRVEVSTQCTRPLNK